MEKLLSVCVPVYNAEKYLDKCLESIVEQTFQDYELILVDDGSKDGSLKVCKKWEEQYPERIRVVAKENSGSLFTRRRCLQEARGTYIYIMDADDYLTDPDALSMIISTLQEKGCDMVFFDCTVNGTDKHFCFPYQDQEIFSGEKLNIIRRYLIEHNGLNPLWNKVFHRDLVDWDEDYSAYPMVTNGTDYFQSIPVVANAKKACYLDKTLYFYRTELNSESIVHKFRETVYISGKTNFMRLVRYSRDWQIPGKETMLRTACMRSVSTSVYKARLIPKKEMGKRKEYLRMIAQDSPIRDYFTLRGLNMPRKVIICLLRMRACGLLARIL